MPSCCTCAPADERFNYSKQQGFNGDALLAVVPAVVQGIKVSNMRPWQPASIDVSSATCCGNLSHACFILA